MGKKDEKVTVAINAQEKIRYFREVEMTRAEYDRLRKRLEDSHEGGEEIVESYLRGCVDPIDSEVDSDEVYIDLSKNLKGGRP